MPSDDFNLIAEGIAQSDVGTGPDERAKRIHRQKFRQLHAKDSRQWRRGDAEAGNKFREEN